MSTVDHTLDFLLINTSIVESMTYLKEIKQHFWAIKKNKNGRMAIR